MVSQHALVHVEMQPERNADVWKKSAAMIRKGKLCDYRTVRYILPHFFF